jgi:hypothetical protein
MQRIAKELHAEGGHGAAWSPRIDTLWRLLTNRQTRLGKIHELRRQAIHRLWRLQITLDSKDAILDIFSSEEMQEEKREEFQLNARINEALEVLARAVASETHPSTPPSDEPRIVEVDPTSRGDVFRGTQSCRYCLRVAKSDEACKGKGAGMSEKAMEWHPSLGLGVGDGYVVGEEELVEVEGPEPPAAMCENSDSGSSVSEEPVDQLLGADVCRRMQTYAGVCRRMLMYADVCGKAGEWSACRPVAWS